MKKNNFSWKSIHKSGKKNLQHMYFPTFLALNFYSFTSYDHYSNCLDSLKKQQNKNQTNIYA